MDRVEKQRRDKCLLRVCRLLCRRVAALEHLYEYPVQHHQSTSTRTIVGLRGQVAQSGDSLCKTPLASILLVFFELSQSEEFRERNHFQKDCHSACHDQTRKPFVLQRLVTP